MIRFWSFLFLLILPTLTNGGTIRPEVDDNKYIEYGKKFHFITKICGIYKKGENYCASAVAINDNWIITAAHVVKNTKKCFITINNEKRLIIKKIICHNEFDESKFGYSDIAMGFCEEKINLEFYPKLYTEKDENNKICSISGYGLTGNFHTGAKLSDNKRRAGSNFVDKIENDLLICTPSRNHENITSLEFLIGSGDSGGGLFIDGKLAGINSCIMSVGSKPNSSYKDESGHTRISNYCEWINEVIEGKKEMDILETDF